jgi:hypothetical protein
MIDQLYLRSVYARLPAGLVESVSQQAADDRLLAAFLWSRRRATHQVDVEFASCPTERPLLLPDPAGREQFLACPLSQKIPLRLHVEVLPI